MLHVYVCDQMKYQLDQEIAMIGIYTYFCTLLRYVFRVLIVHRDFLMWEKSFMILHKLGQHDLTLIIFGIQIIEKIIKEALATEFRSTPKSCIFYVARPSIRFHLLDYVGGVVEGSQGDERCKRHRRYPWCLLGSHDALVSEAPRAFVVFPRALSRFSRGLLPFLHVCLDTAA